MSTIEEVLEMINNKNNIDIELHNDSYGTTLISRGLGLKQGESKTLTKLHLTKSELITIVNGSARKFFVGDSARIKLNGISNVIKQLREKEDESNDNKLTENLENVSGQNSEVDIHRDSSGQPIFQSDVIGDISPIGTFVEKDTLNPKGTVVTKLIDVNEVSTENVVPLSDLTPSNNEVALISEVTQDDDSADKTEVETETSSTNESNQSGGKNSGRNSRQKINQG